MFYVNSFKLSRRPRKARKRHIEENENGRKIRRNL